ncbi:tetratricopeptide repeat protein [Magnetococcus sp. PR-3]|uniref:tetratricopeptide repeat protein n=1 Tax=Magnetococcus sp. PR-3 TaxID=3120355 RepID=UPI002FCE5205
MGKTQEDLTSRAQIEQIKQLLDAGQFETGMAQLQTSLNAHYAQLIRLKFMQSDAWMKAGALDDALSGYQRILQLDPTQITAHYNLGVIYYQKAQWPQAAQQFQAYRAQQPGHFNALNNLIHAWQNMGELAQALTLSKQLLAEHPERYQGYITLGVLRAAMQEHAAAIQAFDQALSLDPTCYTAWFNKGVSYLQQRDLERAIHALHQALKIHPEGGEVQPHLASAYYLKQRYDAWFPWFEQRLQQPHFLAQRRHFSWPFWPGADLKELAGKRLFIQSEQGVGDEALFLEALHHLPPATRVCVEVDARLIPLLKAVKFPQAMEWLPRWQNPDDWQDQRFDYRLCLGTLWARVGMNSRFCAAGQPVLGVDEQQVAHKRAHYQAQAKGRLVVGLSWKTGGYRNQLRNIALSELVAPLLAQWGQACLFVSVQYGAVHEEVAALNAQHGCDMQVDETVDALTDLHGFSVQLASCDLIVTIDNSTAHIGGRLGCPVWVLLPYSPNWFWGLHGEHTPLYPSLKLLRQQAPGQWYKPLDQMAKQLPVAR